MGGKFKLKLKKIKVHTWQLILILIPLLFLAATLLRLDHIRMTELRALVLSADEEGDTERLASSLDALATFTRKNIVINITDNNGDKKIIFGTGPFYLEKSYLRVAEKAVEDAEKKLSDGSNPNGNIFSAAMAVCKPQAIANGWAWNTPAYLDCMTGEINKYPSSENLSTQISADIPSTELYRKEFSSPIWAPSFAGFMVLACLILIVVIFIRFLIWLVIRLSLLFV